MKVRLMRKETFNMKSKRLLALVGIVAALLLHPLVVNWAVEVGRSLENTLMLLYLADSLAAVLWLVLRARRDSRTTDSAVMVGFFLFLATFLVGAFLFIPETPYSDDWSMETAFFGIEVIIAVLATILWNVVRGDAKEI